MVNGVKINLIKVLIEVIHVHFSDYASDIKGVHNLLTFCEVIQNYFAIYKVRN